MRLTGKGSVMKHSLKITFNSPVILIFVFLCFVSTLFGSLTLGKSTWFLFTTYHSSLHSPLTYVRLFTHVLGHSGWEHLIGNVSYLLLLGPILEEKHGSVHILEVILVTALITGVVNYVFFPQVALCGASGVVFAFILLTSFTDFRQGEILVTFLLVAAFYIGQQVYEGIAVQSNVSNLSHILGGIIGAVFGYQMNQKRLYDGI